MTGKKDQNSIGWKGKLRGFSDEVFRNYLIMRKRWEISAFERQRNSAIKDLGNRVFRLIQREKAKIPEVDSVVHSIRDLDDKIQILEEKLREIIMRVDVQHQIPDKSGKPVDLQPTAADTKPPEKVLEKTAVKPKPVVKNEDVEKEIQKIADVALDKPPQPALKKKPVPVKKPAAKKKAKADSTKNGGKKVAKNTAKKPPVDK